MSTSKFVWTPDRELYTPPLNDLESSVISFLKLIQIKLQKSSTSFSLVLCFSYTVWPEQHYVSPHSVDQTRSRLIDYSKQCNISPQCRWKGLWNQSVWSIHLSRLPKDSHLCSEDGKSWYVIWEWNDNKSLLGIIRSKQSFRLPYKISAILSMNKYKANFNPISPGNKGLTC